MSELTDERRDELLEGAQFTLQELRRQQRAGHDSWERFAVERDEARLIIEQDIELRERRSNDLSGDDLVTLNGIRVWLQEELDDGADTTGWRREAIALLSRLLPGNGAKP